MKRGESIGHTGTSPRIGSTCSHATTAPSTRTVRGSAILHDGQDTTFGDLITFLTRENTQHKQRTTDSSSGDIFHLVPEPQTKRMRKSQEEGRTQNGDGIVSIESSFTTLKPAWSSSFSSLRQKVPSSNCYDITSLTEGYQEFLTEEDYQEEHPQEYAKLFPWRLHDMLQEATPLGFSNVISWLPGTNSFRVHQPQLFETDVMPRYFRQTKFKSFRRQINMWGFRRIRDGEGKGGYFHPNFVRGSPLLSMNMQRIKVKNAPHNKPEQETSKEYITESPYGYEQKHYKAATQGFSELTTAARDFHPISLKCTRDSFPTLQDLPSNISCKPPEGDPCMLPNATPNTAKLNESTTLKGEASLTWRNKPSPSTPLTAGLLEISNDEIISEIVNLFGHEARV